MNILAWILFGLIVGIIAYALESNPTRRGIISPILLGIAGALAGGVLANLILGITMTGFNLTSFLIAIAGSLILLFIGTAMRRT